MKKTLSSTALILGFMSVPFSVNATQAQTPTKKEEVNVYSYRQPFLIEPMLDAFSKETGIKVNVKFAKEGLAEKLQQEGKYSPADVLLTVDIARLKELVNKDLVQPLKSPVILSNIPAQFRAEDGRWVALTLRSRSVYSSRDRVGKLPVDFDYMDLASPKWKGKICTRSGKHPYNVSLISSVIARHGEAKAKVWLEGVKANLARKPQGNDRAQVKAISEGLCDISLGNSYYLGEMLADKNQKAWADAIHLNYPGQTKQGAHVNVSGMAMAKFSPNKQNAQKLMEFLASDHAQKMYAELNHEDPVKADVARSQLVSSWGEYRADDMPLDNIAQHHDKAMKLLDEVRFDL